MQPLELGIVRSHAAVIERQGAHTLGGHVLLREHYGYLLGAVVTVVEEDHHVVGFDAADNLSVLVDANHGLHELVGHALVVRALHGLRHIGRSVAHAVHQQVVSHLHSLPTLVAVHGIVTADDRRDLARALRQMRLDVGDEALAALGIGVATVHEAVHEGILDAIMSRYVAKFVEVFYRRVNAAVRRQAHKMNVRALLLGVLESLHDLGIFEDRAVGARAVDLHQILIHHAARADIEVAHLRVAHLTVGQTDVFAVGAQLRVGILLGHGRDIGGVHGRDHVRFGVIAYAPAVENHQ